MGQEVLKGLGYKHDSAWTLSQKFAQHDRRTLRESFDHFEDEEALITFAKSARLDLESIFEADRNDPTLHKEDPPAKQES
jgi:hypothetical protein